MDGGTRSYRPIVSSTPGRSPGGMTVPHFHVSSATGARVYARVYACTRKWNTCGEECGEEEVISGEIKGCQCHV